MNEENMKASHVLASFQLVFILFFNTFYVISAKKCADKLCKEPISIAEAIQDHDFEDDYLISFKKGDELTIFSKYMNADNSIWQGSVRGEPPGLVDSSYIEEKTKFINNDELIDYESNSQHDQKPAEDKKSTSEESKEHVNKIEEENGEIESIDGAEIVKESNGSPVVTEHNDDPSQTAHEHSTDNDMFNDNNKDKDGVSQEKITIREIGTVDSLEEETSLQEPVDDVSQDPNDKNSNAQVASNGKDVNERRGKTEVYTDLNGVQYDVEVENIPSEGDKVDGEVVDKKLQQSGSNEEDADAQSEHKILVQESSEVKEETEVDHEKSAGKRKEGFFSSVRSLVSDFTDNIIKDLQGDEEEQNDKLGKEQGKTGEVGENLSNSEKTEEKVEDDENVKAGSGEHGSQEKPRDVNGFQEKFEQMKAERLERMRGETKSVAVDIPPVDEEEILKEKARRTVEGIPGLLRESDERKEETLTTSQESADATSDATRIQSKTYSDVVLCQSVAIESREVCMDTGTKKECLQDNCCFDETAAPGKQCFFKPSAPESSFSEEHLKDEKQSEEDKNAAVEADKQVLHQEESAAISGRADKTTNFANNEKLESSENEDDTNQVDDEDGDRAMAEDPGTTEHKNEEADSPDEETAPVEKSGDLDEKQDDLPKEKPAAEPVGDSGRTVDDAANGKEAEEDLPKARNMKDDEKQEKVEANVKEVEEDLLKAGNVKDEKQKKVDENEDEDEEAKAESVSGTEEADKDKSTNKDESSNKQQDVGEDERIEEKTTPVAEVDDKEMKTESPGNDVTSEDEATVDGEKSESKTTEDVRQEDEMETVDSTGEQTKDDTRSNSEPSTGDSSENVVSKVDTNEENAEKENDRKDDTRLDGDSSSTKEHKVVTEDQREDARPEVEEGDEEKAKEQVEKKDGLEEKESLKQDDTGREDEVTRHGLNNNVTSSEARESVSDKNTGQQESSEADIEDRKEHKEEDGKEEREEERQEHQEENRGVSLENSQDNVTTTQESLAGDTSKDEVLVKEDVGGNNKQDVPDAEGILATIKKFLPGGETEEKTKSSDEVRKMNVAKVVKEHDGQKVSEENQKEIDDDRESGQDGETSENVKDDGNEAEVKAEPTQATSEANDGNTAEQTDDESSEKSETAQILEEILKEESPNTNDTSEGDLNVLESAIPESKDMGKIEEKSVESGSIHFFNKAEPTLSVEKTVQQKNDESTPQGGEDIKTGIEETKTGLVGTKTVAEMEPEIVPTKTPGVEPSETTTGPKPFEIKFPKLASKWMKNKLMKGQKVKETEEEGSLSSEEKTVEDPLSETCDKDGNCQQSATLSSTLGKSFAGNDADLDDDDIVEPSPEEVLAEEPEVKSVGTMFREKLGFVVRKFREYHNVVSSYGLPMLKPVWNVVKLLGEQMGLGETIQYVEHEANQGPLGVISVPLIVIAFAAYFMLSVLCGQREPPCYGPNLKDIFRTYEGRIRILEAECEGYKERIGEMKRQAEDHVENRSGLEKQLDDEKHERSKSEEQISILKEIVKNLNEKVDLLEEESSKLKQSLDQRSGRINTMEEQLSEKSKDTEKLEEKMKELEELLTAKDEEKNVLNNDIEEFKNQLSKAEDDSDRHKTMLQDWNDRYHELQQKYDDISVSNKTLEEQIRFKDNENELLRKSLVDINGDVHIASDEELSPEEVKAEQAKKVKELMDVSQIRTDFKLCQVEKEKLEDDIKQAVERREKLEGEVNELEIELAKSKASEEETRFKHRETDIKLNALQDYFKNMESDLHRKLTAEEAARMASESELERKLREASTAVQDVELYRKQVEELRKEIDETQLAFRSQISSAEDRVHENWLKFRSAERELEEMKRERDALRRRLYDLKTKSTAAASPEDPISSTVAENLESPSARSDSPATSVRSKRRNSNSRKSPGSGSPQLERKDRVPRRSRDKISPPSWDSDKGPRKRDRDTPPPPPPLWEPNMGPPTRRRRDSPNDAEEGPRRRRREMYTPPPPPPPDMISPPRRRHGERRSPSPPPPPPSFAISQPRGGPGGGPVGPPPQGGPPFSMRGAPPRINGPVTRLPPPPHPDMISPQPIRGAINGISFDQTPPQRYLIRGGPDVGVRPILPSDIPSGTPTGVSIPGNINSVRAPPPTNISPLRGAQRTQGQTSPYINTTFTNSTPRPVVRNNVPHPV